MHFSFKKEMCTRLCRMNLFSKYLFLDMFLIWMTFSVILKMIWLLRILFDWSIYIFVNETEIGLGLTGFGIFFSFLGIIFFFDKGLLAMGNVSNYVSPTVFVAQVPLLDLLFCILFAWCLLNMALFLCGTESDTILIRGDINHWTEVLHAVLHET